MMQDDQRPVFRFAPSPNGRLHLGHAYSALINQKLARATGGRLLLRIENTDLVRCTPLLEQRMLEDLAWLGFEWDGEPLRQSERSPAYRAALDRLGEAGLVYPAFLSRAEARQIVESAANRGESWSCDPDGVPHYPAEDRSLSWEDRAARLAAGQPHALRIDMKEAMLAGQAEGATELSWREEGAGPGGESGNVTADPALWGDFLLSGRDRAAAYHLACVVDDAYQGVTHVVRGRDLFHATSAHRLLQRLLGLPEPVYFHHDLMVGEDGRKLSKSRSDTSLAELRAAGSTPSDIRRMVGIDDV